MLKAEQQKRMGANPNRAMQIQHNHSLFPNTLTVSAKGSVLYSQPLGDGVVLMSV